MNRVIVYDIAGVLHGRTVAAAEAYACLAELRDLIVIHNKVIAISVDAGTAEAAYRTVADSTVIALDLDTVAEAALYGDTVKSDAVAGDLDKRIPAYRHEYARSRGVGGRIEIEAVSYTHLDVYKRQPLQSRHRSD